MAESACAAFACSACGDARDARAQNFFASSNAGQPDALEDRVEAAVVAESIEPWIDLQRGDPLECARMIFRIQPPSPPLRGHVEYYWYHEGVVSDYAMERLVPDGGVELIIDLTATPKFWRPADDESGTRHVRATWISGQHSRPIAIEAAKGSCMIGARFLPGGSYAVLAQPVCALNDGVVELDLLWGRAVHDLREQLYEATSVDQRFALLDRALVARASGRTAQDRALSAAVARLAHGAEPVSIRGLAADIGISQRRLVGLFDERVGLKPKMLARVFRFQRVLRRLQQEPFPGWSTIAADFGYFDQAHFTRDFQELSGMRPGEYLRARGEYLNFIPMR
jgi:AraC-like DNA-binding protein